MLKLFYKNGRPEIQEQIFTRQAATRRHPTTKHEIELCVYAWKWNTCVCRLLCISKSTCYEKCFSATALMLAGVLKHPFNPLGYKKHANKK